jgi:putative nucleotidyltransferase with HDIG domain
MQTQSKLNEKFLFYHDLVESIITVLEARDAYTADHSRRVSDLTQRLMAQLGVDEAQAEEIHLAAEVHDIGKISIPDSILLKPEKLTDDEWNIMKSHSAIGAEMLNKSKQLSSISNIVLHHHERFDGKGYPQGLKGYDIPFGSRIIAICDSVDAMLHKRAYRNAMTVEACKNEIQKNIGLMYDPDIAQCMLDHWDNIVKKGG